ncbi:MAG: IS3 family transposase [Desulfovibrionaceae bacterium]|nr:IS3 family transposase [Desulfovibrionaceae bacterium]
MEQVDKALAENPDLSPAQLVAKLADNGIYLASESTMYRRLRSRNMCHQRGRIRKRKSRPISSHSATAPNQVWMWDITYLIGPTRGVFHYLYLISDLFSRYIVGWGIWPEQSADHSSELIKKACREQKDNGTPHVLHSDNGGPMRAVPMIVTLQNLGIAPSFSRPRVSNDNAYAESLFRTLKYAPSYPAEGFATIKDERDWCAKFVHWYNNVHYHSWLKYLTPAQRHYGLCEDVVENRIAVYEAAKAKNPIRWTKNIRNWTPDEIVYLNPINDPDKGKNNSTS